MLHSALGLIAIIEAVKGPEHIREDGLLFQLYLSSYYSILFWYNPLIENRPLKTRITCRDGKKPIFIGNLKPKRCLTGDGESPTKNVKMRMGTLQIRNGDGDVDTPCPRPSTQPRQKLIFKNNTKHIFMAMLSIAQYCGVIAFIGCIEPLIENNIYEQFCCY